jgi:hypothetical protein
MIVVTIRAAAMASLSPDKVCIHLRQWPTRKSACVTSSCLNFIDIPLSHRLVSLD